MVSKRKLEIAVAVAVLIMVIILLWILFKRDKPDVTSTPETPPPETIVTPPTVNPANIPTPGVVSATTIARTFIERFGSYSTETDFANVDDIRVLATPSFLANSASSAGSCGCFQAEMDQQVAVLRQGMDPDGGYTGVSTTIISIKTQTEAETSTTFLITTQREESVGNPGNTTVRYQDVEISLVKSGDDWLVDDVTWK